MRAGAARRRQLEHLWSERGDDPTVLGHPVLVELVEVAPQRVDRLLVLLGGLRDVRRRSRAGTGRGRPPRMRWNDSATGPGRRGPDVDDAGGDLQRRGVLQNGLDPIQFGRRRAAYPDRAVAQRLDLLGLLRGDPTAERAEAAQICSGFRHGCLNQRCTVGYSAAAESSPGVAATSAGADNGSKMMKRVLPGCDSTRISPWCFSTMMRRARSRPRPSPSPNGFVVKNAVKIRSMMSSGMPGPSSPDLHPDHVVAVACRPDGQRAVAAHRLDGVVDDDVPYLIQTRLGSSRFQGWSCRFPLTSLIGLSGPTLSPKSVFSVL